jgi:hypothetical protein
MTARLRSFVAAKLPATSRTPTAHHSSSHTRRRELLPMLLIYRLVFLGYLFVGLCCVGSVLLLAVYGQRGATS